MRTVRVRAGVAVLAILLAGWLVGFVVQRAIVEATGYLDVPPPLLILGLALCGLGGVTAWLLAEFRRRRDVGGLAGITTMASIIAGYLALAFAYRDRFAGRESGETITSLILESWFWIGVPLLVSAAMGILGWMTAERLYGKGSDRTIRR